MIQAYSKNTTVTSGADIPFNNTSIQKGCSAVKSGTSSIELNRCGVYMISVDASAVATAVGTIRIQLSEDGVLQPQAIASETATDTTGIHSMSFQSLIQVKTNNSCKCCDAGKLISIVNVGVDATFENINVIVTKLC